MSGEASGIETTDPSEGPWPQPADVGLLGLRIDDRDRRCSRFVLDRHLCRRDGALFGGAALAVTLASFEGVSERAALWATVQFVATAAMGEEIECRVTTVAHGRAVDQLQLIATVGDRVVFSAMGATAEPRRNGISGAGRVMPRAESPETAVRLGVSRQETESETVGHYLASEFREAALEEPSSPGHVAMWARMLNGEQTTAANLGFLADMVPIAVCRAAGVDGAGTSLDNSLRVGQIVDTEWVLVELEAHVAAGGYGYGVSHLWAPDGTLMATGSQTAKLFSFETFVRRQAELADRADESGSD